MNLMEFLRQHQLNIMLVLEGICVILAILVPFTGNIRKRRKQALFSLELGAALLLACDRFAYIYRGDTSTLGFWMVRICNFCVYFFSLTIIYSFNSYILDFISHQPSINRIPKRLRLCKILTVIAIICLIISQFTHAYYYFDETNHYVRGKLFIFSYIFPISIITLISSVIIQYFSKIRSIMKIPLVFFMFLPASATIIQIFSYGVSLSNISIVGEAIILYVFVLVDLNNSVEKANKLKLKVAQEEQIKMRNLFEQTATALANAIDAKDQYTHGHSVRVADYSRKIAQLAGKDEEFCTEVYFAALLHDVGKIGVPNEIINKNGKLTDEEYNQIKMHPVIGKQILSSIKQSPYLSIGANYHHERYDGHGYPEGLKGDDIPEIARIIAVADAYDAMTSKRSYREPIPQETVREEIVKGSGYQFDPNFARLMLHLIDLDTQYTMKEKSQVQELDGQDELICSGDASNYSEGIVVDKNILNFKVCCSSLEANINHTEFSILLFDSLDGRIHHDPHEVQELLYTEYALINFDGTAINKNCRKIKNEISRTPDAHYDEWKKEFVNGIDYEGQAVKVKDHVLIKLTNKYQTSVITIALKDSSRYTYLSLTGKKCKFSNVEFNKSKEKVNDYYIPRIAEELSYKTGPIGDIPNIQVDGWCSAVSEAIAVTNGMSISFHSKSLATARLIWHCPYIKLFYYDENLPQGKNYKEIVLIRIDGENWEDNKYADNSISISQNENFEGWSAWKALNKTGFDCHFSIKQSGNKITVYTENGGIAIKSTSLLKETPKQIFAALTGDQCVITNIKIQR